MMITKTTISMDRESFIRRCIISDIRSKNMYVNIYFIWIGLYVMSK